MHMTIHETPGFWVEQRKWIQYVHIKTFLDLGRTA